MNSDKVVVWTQVYNAEKTLRRAMDSILNQTHSNIEYYVLNNACTDGSGAIIQEYAAKDSRVIPLSVAENSLEACADFLPSIFNNSSARWFVWCDADDQYDLTYLEKMIAFANQNQLEIASCGYRKIDGITDKIVKERVISEPLILYGNDFATYFPEYRGFTVFLWAKLVSTELLRTKYKFARTGRHASCIDSVTTLSWFKKAKRAGVYPEALYDYYQYPTSVSHIDSYVNVKDYFSYWRGTKNYISSCGKVSRRNKAFLYAIYFSIVEELIQMLCRSSYSPDVKLQYLQELLEEPHMRVALHYEPAGEFQILAFRPQLVDRIRNLILQQSNQLQDKTLTYQVIKLLDTVWGM